MQELEKTKYEMMWRCPEYRWNSPGYNAVHDFLNYFKGQMHEEGSIIDFGCGTGRAGIFFLLQNFSVYMVDITSNCLDEENRYLLHLCADKIAFIEACLWDLPETLNQADWIYCCDVLEHLPEEYLDTALSQMAMRTKKGGFLQIYLQEEPFGELIGKQLHLTLRPREWWVDQISKYWKIEAFGPEIEGFRFSVFLQPLKQSEE